MTSHKATVVVIGAGVIGCAVAARLSSAGYSVTVLEQGPRIAEGVTSRNSGVIHAGLYYKPGSIKARACVRGKALLYEWCEKKRVPHRCTGKWIVGPAEDRDAIDQIEANAQTCGVTDLSRATGAGLLRAVPGIIGSEGLFSPSTGIVDPYELSRSLQETAQNSGAQFIMDTTVLGIQKARPGYEIETSRGPIESEIVINAAGLYADNIAQMVGIQTYKIYPYRGNYFRFKAREKHRYLIYPAIRKGAAGLGVHLTLSLDGTCRLGPDVELTPSKNDFTPPADITAKRLLFFEAARRYLKNITLEDLTYDSCGLRPKLRAPHEKEEKDFVVAEDLPGFINLVGIESPGLTASLALAESVQNQLEGTIV